MADQGGNHTWPSEYLNASARLQNLRDQLTSERHNGLEQQRALEAFDNEMYERAAIGGMGALERRRRRRRDFDTHVHEHESPAERRTNQPVHTPVEILRARRRRELRPNQRMMRHRGSQHDAARPEQPEPLATIRRPTPPFGYSEAFTDNYLSSRSDERDQQYRTKRRKLDDGTFDDESRIFSYGDKGRVIPGPLNMEIISCDGGEYDEPPRGMVQYVLKDDTSVYSTKSNRCNMLLKHAGGAPFSLTKIVFRAPRDGHDAPVQEGMIFVTMDDESLLEKTSQYEVRYSPKSYRHHYQRRHDLYRPSQDYMNSTRPPLRSINQSRNPRETYEHHPWLHYGENIPELETALVPGFNISFTDPSDCEDLPTQTPPSPHRWRDDGGSRSARLYADRYRPVYTDDLSYVELSASSDDSEDEDSPFRPALPLGFTALERDRIEQSQRLVSRTHTANERNDPNWQSDHSRTRRTLDDWQDLHHFVTSRRATPARTELRNNESGEMPESSGSTQSPDATKSSLDSSTGHEDRQASQDTIAPHARFFIHRHKSSIAVNFDPPISGRYVLIKLWAACPNANIDIQSIITHGYGGPRFFPAQDLR